VRASSSRASSSSAGSLNETVRIGFAIGMTFRCRMYYDKAERSNGDYGRPSPRRLGSPVGADINRSDEARHPHRLGAIERLPFKVPLLESLSFKVPLWPPPSP